MLRSARCARRPAAASAAASAPGGNGSGNGSGNGNGNGGADASVLFTPYQLGSVALKHRVVMAPMTRDRWGAQ